MAHRSALQPLRRTFAWIKRLRLRSLSRRFKPCHPSKPSSFSAAIQPKAIFHLTRTVSPCHFVDAAIHNIAIFAALQSLTVIGGLNEQLQTSALMQSSLTTSAGGLGFANPHALAPLIFLAANPEMLSVFQHMPLIITSTNLLRHQPANILTTSLQFSFTKLMSLSNTESATLYFPEAVITSSTTTLCSTARRAKTTSLPCTRCRARSPRSQPQGCQVQPHSSSLLVLSHCACLSPHLAHCSCTEI